MCASRNSTGRVTAPKAECAGSTPAERSMSNFINVWPPNETGPVSQCVDCKVLVRSAKEMMEHKCPTAGNPDYHQAEFDLFVDPQWDEFIDRPESDE